MAFSLRRVLRQISGSQLEQYFTAKGADIDPAWWKRPEPKLASALAGYLIAKPDSVRDSIIADCVRIAPMSDEQGRRALINAASNSPEVIAALASLGNDYERSLWMLLNRLETFREAEELVFYDYHSQGRNGRHYKTESGKAVSQLAGDISSFKSAVCAFYRRTEGSGASCHVEFVERQENRSILVTVYVEGLPDHQMDFVERQFRRRIAFPAKEAAIVYETETGCLSTVVKGGRPAHEVLREAFARHLLKIDPKFDVVAQRVFTLDELTKKPALAPEPEYGVISARVRKLGLSSRRYDGALLTLQAPAGDPTVSVFDLADQWLGGRSGACRRFSVVHATIALHCPPAAGGKRPRTINIELTKPNSSNLKDMTDADRVIAEAHIDKWRLRERPPE